MRKLSLLSLSIIGLPIIASAATVTVYDDVPENAWFAGYVHQATTLDIVGGYRDTNGRLTGKFGPSDKLTIAQALKMSVVAAGYDPTEYTVGDNWVS
ncbi:MAG: S-layer homology domain-containing protein, partial [Candidatus Peribacteraceae bacterium]|nr:S-layer homology domain-containing protein [Candidatus Peribacteraceae bacterium]